MASRIDITQLNFDLPPPYEHSYDHSHEQLIEKAISRVNNFTKLKQPSGNNLFNTSRWMTLEGLSERSDDECATAYDSCIEMITDICVVMGESDFVTNLISFLIEMVEEYFVPFHFEKNEIRLRILWISLSIALRHNVESAHHYIICIGDELEEVLKFTDNDKNDIIAYAFFANPIYFMEIIKIIKPSNPVLITYFMEHCIFENILSKNQGMFGDIITQYPELMYGYKLVIGETTFNIFDIALLFNGITAIMGMFNCNLVNDNLINRYITYYILLTKCDDTVFSSVFNMLTGNIAIEVGIICKIISESYTYCKKGRMLKFLELFPNLFTADAFYKIMLIEKPSASDFIKAYKSKFSTKECMFELVEGEPLIIKLCKNVLCLDHIMHLCDTRVITSVNLFTETNIGQQIVESLISSPVPIMFARYFVSVYKQNIKLSETIVNTMITNKSTKQMYNLLLSLDFSEELLHGTKSQKIFEMLFNLVDKQILYDNIIKYHKVFSTFENIVRMVHFKECFNEVFKILFLYFIETCSTADDLILYIMNASLHSSYKRIVITTITTEPLNPQIASVMKDMDLRSCVFDAGMDILDKCIILNIAVDKYKENKIFPLSGDLFSKIIVEYVNKQLINSLDILTDKNDCKTPAETNVKEHFIEDQLIQLFSICIKSNLVEQNFTNNVMETVFTNKTLSLKLFAGFVKSEFFTEQHFLENFRKTVWDYNRFGIMLENGYFTKDLCNKIDSHGFTLLQTLIINKNLNMAEVLKYVTMDNFRHKNTHGLTCLDLITNLDKEFTQLMILLESPYTNSEMIKETTIKKILIELKFHNFSKAIGKLLETNLLQEYMLTIIGPSNTNILTQLALNQDQNLLVQISKYFETNNNVNIFNIFDNKGNNCLDIAIAQKGIKSVPLQILSCASLTHEILLRTDLIRLSTFPEDFIKIRHLLTDEILLHKRSGPDGDTLLSTLIHFEPDLFIQVLISSQNSISKDILIKNMSDFTIWLSLKTSHIQTLSVAGFLSDNVLKQIGFNKSIDYGISSTEILQELYNKNKLVIEYIITKYIGINISYINEIIQTVVQSNNFQMISYVVQITAKINLQCLLHDSILQEVLKKDQKLFVAIYDPIIQIDKNSFKLFLNNNLPKMSLKYINLELLRYLISEKLIEMKFILETDGLVDLSLQMCTEDELLKSGLITKQVLSKKNGLNQTFLHKLAKNKKIVAFAFKDKLYDDETLLNRDIFGDTLLDELIRTKNPAVDDIILQNKDIVKLLESRDRTGINLFMKLLKYSFYKTVLEMIKTNLVTKEMLNNIDSNGNICIAYVLENTELLDKLLKHPLLLKSTLQTVNNDKLNCLMYAIQVLRSKSANIFFEMLTDAQLDDLKYFDQTTGSVLTVAARYNSDMIGPILKRLAKKDMNLLNILSDGLNFFQIACIYNTEAVKEILKETHSQKIDISLQVTVGSMYNYAKYTSLIFATIYQPDSVLMILNSKYGSSKLIEDARLINGNSLVELALRQQPKSLVHFLTNPHCADEIKLVIQSVGKNITDYLKSTFKLSLEQILSPQLATSGPIVYFKLYNVPTDMTDPHVCTTCYAYKNQLLFMPCKHGSCVGCALNLTSGKCPQCRATISDKISISFI